jgi:hypothetical protein
VGGCLVGARPPFEHGANGPSPSPHVPPHPPPSLPPSLAPPRLFPTTMALLPPHAPPTPTTSCRKAAS